MIKLDSLSLSAHLMVIAGLWIIFYFIHSAMASSSLKEKFEGIGLQGKVYRLFYNGIAVIIFIWIYIHHIAYQTPVFLEQSRFSTVGGVILGGIGLFLIKKSFEPFDLKEFLGFKEEKGTDSVYKQGVYGHVRHPMYSGTILLLLGYWLYSPEYDNSVFVLISFLYLPFGIYFEEKKLIKNFGNDYLEYRKKVPSVIPRLPSKF